MRKKWLGIAIAVCLTLSLIISGCAAPAPTTPTTPTATTPTPTTPTPTVEKPTYTWRFTNTWAGFGLMNEGAEMFIDECDRLSDGRIVWEFYPGDLLGDYSWKLEQMSMGTLEGGLESLSTGLDPRLEMVTIPYVVFDWDAAYELYSPGGALYEIFYGVCEDVGWKLLGTWSSCFNDIAVTEAKGGYVPTPDEVSKLGVKCRTMLMKTDELAIDAMGYLAIPMARAEVETALSTGVIDGRGGMCSMELIGFTGLAKYDYRYRMRPEVQLLLMSLDVFNSLPLEDQQIVQEAANNTTDWLWEITPTTNDSEREVAAAEYGWEIVELTPEQMGANVKAVREAVWPYMETVIGTVLMDKIREYAQPVPGM